MKNDLHHKGIVLFDGYCNLCSWSVRFIIKYDLHDYFRFASQQSEEGKSILQSLKFSDNYTESVIFIENNAVYLKSDAYIRILKKMKYLQPVAYIILIVPKFIRDFIYTWIARNRFNWFGKRNTCYIPKDNEQIKFL